MTNDEIDAIVGAIWNQLDALRDMGEVDEHDVLESALRIFREMKENE